MDKDEIYYGRYDKVRKSLQGLSSRACKIIDKYVNFMKDRQDLL